MAKAIDQEKKAGDSAQSPAPQSEPKVEQEASSNEGLVKMFSNGTTTHVHPTCVKSHEAAGWKVVE